MQDSSEVLIRDSAIRVPAHWLSQDDLRAFELPNPKAVHDRKAPETISFVMRVGDEYWLPRNFPIHNFFPGVKLHDKTVLGSKILYPKLQVTMRDYQMTAVNRVMWDLTDQMLIAPCRSGKTTMAEFLIQQYGRKAVVLVASSQLQGQWQERIEKDMGLTAGVVSSKKKKPGDITICLVQSLYGKTPADFPEFDDVGLVIIDEAHELGAESWSKALYPFKAALRVSITGTPREDDLKDLMHYVLGPIGMEIERDSLVQSGHILVPDVMCIRYPGKEIYTYKPLWGAAKLNPPKEIYRELDFPRTQAKLAKSKERNLAIADSLVKCLSAGRKTMVIVSRLAHMEALHEAVEELRGPTEHSVIVGKMSKAEFESACTEYKLIYAILQLGKQGIDIPDLDTVVLATPFSKAGLIEQMANRPCTPWPGKKKPLVIDFVDNQNIMFLKMYNKRKTVYQKLGATFRE